MLAQERADVNASAAATEPSACVIVADRAHLGELTEMCTELGAGGWGTGAALFAAQPAYEYLLLAACEPRRIARRAPLILLARNRDALRDIVREACRRLDDVTCAWVFLCETPTRAIAEPIIAADIRTDGTA